ncbi:MAG: CADD family putative folate metabolism protein [Bacteroidota bacterium]
MSATLLASLDAVLDERSMLKHPFYQAWNEGKLTQEMLKSYACQYYHFVKDFPRMVSAVHSNTPDISVRQELLQNLMEEEQGQENHPALWMRFANALGATTQEVLAATPLSTTTHLVEEMMDSCKGGSFQEGAAALYAYEAQIPEVSRVKIRGLKQFYGMDDPAAIKFFSVHQEADVLHSRSEREMIANNTAPEAEGDVVNSARRTANALWKFLDGVYDAYVGKHVAMCT